MSKISLLHSHSYRTEGGGPSVMCQKTRSSSSAVKTETGGSFIQHPLEHISQYLQITQKGNGQYQQPGLLPRKIWIAHRAMPRPSPTLPWTPAQKKQQRQPKQRVIWAFLPDLLYSGDAKNWAWRFLYGMLMPQPFAKHDKVSTILPSYSLSKLYMAIFLFLFQFRRLAQFLQQLPYVMHADKIFAR